MNFRFTYHISDPFTNRGIGTSIAERENTDSRTERGAREIYKPFPRKYMPQRHILWCIAAFSITSIESPVIPNKIMNTNNLITYSNHHAYGKVKH